MKVAVIDGQGAGLGKTIIKKLKKDTDLDVCVIALGTNSLAMSNMVKSGADIGLCGEDNICNYLRNEEIDCLVGPIGIICNGGINGEVTSEISNIIFQIECTKYLFPLQKHGIYIPGTRNLQIKEIIEEIILDIKSYD
ncbi:DUF3842 family protein [Clostridium sp. MSJ-11]|uniref:DUF3842 family protein n=1 Tax=Clostridium mobile TaxID=2841512 RepID=A0ABS6EKE2_9CLOT|nr:DUF3842 family protein [Clostridium mobile]MBU5485141.1 DUF3842 family protein [Clostridium mobile]